LSAPITLMYREREASPAARKFLALTQVAQQAPA
jgi:hypothetical protein